MSKSNLLITSCLFEIKNLEKRLEKSESKRKIIMEYSFSRFRSITER